MLLLGFNTFQHRTLVYKARKKLDGVVRIRLDLIQNRYNLLNDDKDFWLKIRNNQICLC